jgi:hypothetical protein
VALLETIVGEGVENSRLTAVIGGTVCVGRFANTDRIGKRGVGMLEAGAKYDRMSLDGRMDGYGRQV